MGTRDGGDFMFTLSDADVDLLVSQFVIPSGKHLVGATCNHLVETHDMVAYNHFPHLVKMV